MRIALNRCALQLLAYAGAPKNIFSYLAAAKTAVRIVFTRAPLSQSSACCCIYAVRKRFF
jgi:hypothetical protein